MKKFFVICFFTCVPCFAAERIKMQEFPESEKNIRELVDGMCESANSQNTVAFLDCFTKNKNKNSFKKQVQQVFAKPIQMSVVEFDITSEQEDKIEFDFVYYWNYRTDPKKMVTTKVIAKKENNTWKIDDSKISKEEIEPVEDDLPKDIARHDACANGNCRIPAINMNFNQNGDDLPKDIGRHNFGACPGGKCGVR